MMNGMPSAEELSVVVLVLVILLVFGLFFVVKGLRMPPNFNKNAQKRRELRKHLEEAEENSKKRTTNPGQ